VPQSAERNKEKYEARKTYFRKLLGSECVDCGSDENLEFDHIDPELKRFSVSQIMLGRFDVLEEEMEKCQLLCHECHGVKSAMERETAALARRAARRAPVTFDGLVSARKK
jgi:5-methylcytosine-specific restriction endonuclease McrA